MKVPQMNTEIPAIDTSDLQVLLVRRRLLEASYAGELEMLRVATGISRGTLLHALLAIDGPQPEVRLLGLWREWKDGLTSGREYENFAVYVRHRCAPPVHRP